MNLNLLSHGASDSPESMPIMDYLAAWAKTPELNANTAGRLVRAIGEPEIVDTSKDLRLFRAFSGRTVYRYAAFADFFGIEDAIREIVVFLNTAALGLEQRKQILFLNGPVRSGKSSIVARLQELYETQPVWVLGVRTESKIETSPIFENPLGLFSSPRLKPAVAERYGIPLNRLSLHPSLWASSWVQKQAGEVESFVAVKVWPSMATQTCMASVDLGNLKHPNVSDLIGSVGDKEEGSCYTGGMNITTQGILELRELSYLDMDFLFPFIEATQGGRYVGARGIGHLPYEGVIIAHSNRLVTSLNKAAEDSRAEALIDRMSGIVVPYCTRVTEEEMIFEKYFRDSGLNAKLCAPGSLELMAHFSLLTKLSREKDMPPLLKIRYYDGTLPVPPLKEKGIQSRNVDVLRAQADESEGSQGLPPRTLLKKLGEIAHADPNEVGVDPVKVLETLVNYDQWHDEEDSIDGMSSSAVKEVLIPICFVSLHRSIGKAYFEDYVTYSTQRLEKYLAYADAWVDEQAIPDTETGKILSLDDLAVEMAKLEKGLEMKDVKGFESAAEFRRKIVKMVLGYQADQLENGASLLKALDPIVMRVFELNMLETREKMLPIIGFDEKPTAELKKKHEAFMSRLCAQGFTARQARRSVEWYLKN